MGWPVHFPKSHTNWAGFFRPRTLQKSYLAMFAARPTGQPRGGPPRPRPPLFRASTAPSRGHPPGIPSPAGTPAKVASQPTGHGPSRRNAAKTPSQLASPGVRPQAPGQLVTPGPRPSTNWRAATAAGVGPSRRPAQDRQPTGEVSCPWERPPRPGAPGAKPPSKRPALPDPLMGGCKHKSSQGRADAQRLVATRLLDRLHDPLGHFSRLQRIHPRAR
jgi:hypothetical protein